MTTSTKGIITGRKVLFGMVAFFGTIIAVNGVFAYLALESFPGLSAEHAYQEGIQYNHTLDAAAAQRKRGWRSAVAVDTARAGGDDLVGVTLTGADGHPITGLGVTVGLRRLANADMDRKLDLKEAAPGRYTAALRLPARGLWQVVVDARTRDGQAYRMVHQIEVAP